MLEALTRADELGMLVTSVCEVPLLAWVSRRLTSSYDSRPLPPTAGTISGLPQHSADSSHYVAVCYSLGCPWYLLIKFF